MVTGIIEVLIRYILSGKSRKSYLSIPSITSCVWSKERVSPSSRDSFWLLFSQNKSTKTVADIWANGSKLHVQYSDGSSKDMDMPPSLGVQFKYYRYDKYKGTLTYDSLWQSRNRSNLYLTGNGPELLFVSDR